MKKRALAGFFWILREAHPFNVTKFSGDGENTDVRDLFDATSFSEAVEALAQETIARLRSEDSWESPYDYFVTSPLTGQAKATDKEIETGFLDATSSEPDTRIKVQRSSRFLEVKSLTSKGYEKITSFATLFHKYQNADDALSLLRYAGIKLDKPDLSEIQNEADKREKAMAFLGKVCDELCVLINDFQQVALDLSQQKPVRKLDVSVFPEAEYHKEKDLNTFASRLPTTKKLSNLELKVPISSKTTNNVQSPLEKSKPSTSSKPPIQLKPMTRDLQYLGNTPASSSAADAASVFGVTLKKRNT